MPKAVHLTPIEGGRSSSLAQRPDEELMLLVRAGATDALSELVARHDRRLASYCGKVTGKVDAVDELVQETWLRLWAHRSTYRSEGKFLVLLFTMARNVCRNHGRSLRRMHHWFSWSAQGGEDLAEIRDEHPDQLDALLEQERSRDVQEALLALSAPMREALILRFQEELDYGDIAEIVGAPSSTVRSRVHYGMKELGRILQKRGSQ